MFKCYKFKIKRYRGFAIHLGWFKLEIITFREKKMIRLEWSNWDV